MATGRDQRTLKQDELPAGSGGTIPFLTIAAHPDAARVGDRQVLSFDRDGRMAISRFDPEFLSHGSAEAAPLRDPYVSRRPFYLRELEHGGVELMPAADGTPVRIDGEPVAEPIRFAPEILEQGVVLNLAGRVVLVLHALPPDALRSRAHDLGLVGQSAAITRVRRQIRRVAKHDVPVLVRGESGTGKELVASAVHQQSARGRAPFISVNMAAVPASTAAAALFGHTKGAFTGAVSASAGFFGSADGGTLFLDEIGETSLELQAALLRALESGEVQPVGDDRTRQVNVRLIAATDAALERAVDEGRFRRALLERLRAYEIRIGPLRERREDVGSLLLHFLAKQLDDVGLAELLVEPPEGQRPWLPAWWVAAAVRHDWPGNVRELRNAACTLAIDWCDAAEIPPEPEVERLVGGVARSGERTQVRVDDLSPASGPDSQGADPRPAISLNDDRVMEALRRNGWQPSAAAKRLGVSRSALYAFIQQSPTIPKAGSLSAEQIEQALLASEVDTKRAAAQLCVTERALKLRMRDLGLK